MLSLDIRRVAEVRIVLREPASNDNHLVPVDHIRTATSMRIQSGPVVSGKCLDPSKGWNRQDVGIIVSECFSETVSAIQVTMYLLALQETVTCVSLHVVRRLVISPCDAGAKLTAGPGNVARRNLSIPLGRLHVVHVNLLYLISDAVGS